MQKGYSVLFVLLALGCQNKSTDTKVTNDIIACVDASDSLITQSLWKFEQYLIARNYVVKSSLSSYIDFKQECLNNHVEIDRSDLHDYMYDHGNTQMFLASVTRMATIIKCINNSDLKNAEPDLYEAFCYTFSMHERGAAKILQKKMT